MTKISILTKRSVLLIFLVSSAASPLFASTIYICSTSERYHETAISQSDIKNVLISKGLENSVATKKSQAVLKSSQNSYSKLTHLSNNPNLALPKNKIIETLAKYALFDKECDLNSYDSAVGFVQSINPKLSDVQLRAIKEIVKL